NASELGQAVQHRIGGFDGLAVHFVGALRGDHVHQFFGHVDVGGFDVCLQNRACTIQTGLHDVGRAGRVGFQVQVLSHAVQTGGVDEGRQLQLPDLHVGTGRTRLRHGYGAVATDRDRECVVGNI